MAFRQPEPLVVAHVPERPLVGRVPACVGRHGEAGLELPAVAAKAFLRFPIDGVIVRESRRPVFDQRLLPLERRQRQSEDAVREGFMGLRD